MTEEQRAPCESNSDVIKIEAGAGTGKTTTLRGIAEAKRDKRQLYVAFNKSIQVEASRKFPSNVTCKTAHSLAYGAIGRDYGNVHGKLQGDIKPFHVTRQLTSSLSGVPSSAHNLYGGRVIETVKNYLVSADSMLSPKHVSIGDAPVERSHFDPQRILQDAMQVWTAMQDLRSEVPMLHDGYLKLYQVAARRLDLKGDVVHLRGLGAESKIRPLAASEGYAYLSRGNAALFDRAVKALTKNEPFSFVGDIRGYRFDQILDVYQLSIKGQVKDPFIRSFSSFDELVEYAEMINDREVKSRCKIVTAYGRDIPGLLERIERAALAPVEDGNVEDNRLILTTGHKSKGLEFPNVQLAGDFMEFLDSDTGQLIDMSKADTNLIEEINVNYVGVTRAQRVLHLNEQLEAYLEYLEELAANRSSRPSMA
ncbi:TPA: hypothetical protein VDT67_005344 [Pseudomonas aeruginosa]|nr:hypothetical protein [Pseudomonas aeruginosa]